MKPAQDGGPLPGGLTVRGARRHVPQRRSAWPAAVLGVLVVACLANAGDTAVAVIVALLTGALVFHATRPAGVRVTAQSQPDLWTAVAQTTARLGVPPPRRVWLTYRSEVVVRARRRRHDLMIGLPLLACFDEHELRSLVAHELAQMTFVRPDLVVPLAHCWRDVAVARSDDEATPADQQVEQDLRNLALAVERVADAAAASAAGSREAAARATAVVDGLKMTLRGFHRDLDLPRPSLRRLVRLGLEDIDEVWRRVLSDGLPLWLWDDEMAVELAHKHPILGEALLDLDEADVALRGPRSPIRLHPIDQRSRRRLARGALGIGALTFVRWHTIETAPPQWWIARASHPVERLRSDVAKALGRQPVDHAEMAEVLLLRDDELVAVREPVRLVPVDSAGEDEPDDEPQPLPPILLILVEDVLLPRGWRLEHPAVRGVLIGPHGERVDARTLTTDTYLEGLRQILSTHADDPA